MTKQRFSEIYSIALSAMRTMKRYGSVQMQKLAKCSLSEIEWLKANRPTILPFTRIFDYDPDDYKEDSSRPQRAKRPIIREIWVGARSLASLGEEDDSERMARGISDDEDQAELTDLQTLLYHDAKTGLPLITDEEGITRPIRPGDVIQIAWGANEDLDALFMDEAADPRSESDQLMRELTRDQVRANNYHEEACFNPSARMGMVALGHDGRLRFPEIGGVDIQFDSRLEQNEDETDEAFNLRRRRVAAIAHQFVNTAPVILENMRQKDDFDLRREADIWTEEIMKKSIAENHHEWSDLDPQKAEKLKTALYQDIYPKAIQFLKKQNAPLKFDKEGKVSQGRFIPAKEYLEEVEHNLRETERILDQNKVKAAPKATPKEVFRRTPNPFLSQPSKRPVVKPGQRWLHISRHGTKDLTGLAQQFIGPVIPRTSSMTNKV